YRKAHTTSDNHRNRRPVSIVGKPCLLPLATGGGSGVLAAAGGTAPLPLMRQHQIAAAAHAVPRYFADSARVEGASLSPTDATGGRTPGHPSIPKFGTPLVPWLLLTELPVAVQR